MPPESLSVTLLVTGMFVLFAGCLAWANWYSHLPPKRRAPDGA
jgi:hypothetical protein